MLSIILVFILESKNNILSKVKPHVSSKLMHVRTFGVFLESRCIFVLWILSVVLDRSFFQHFFLPLRFLSPRNGTAGPLSEGSAAPNPCSTVLQQKPTTWKVFFSGITGEFNTGRQGTKGRDGLSWWSRRWDSALNRPHLPILPFRTDGSFSFRMM